MFDEIKRRNFEQNGIQTAEQRKPKGNENGEEVEKKKLKIIEY